MTRAKHNPFALPGKWGPLVPLCPWDEPAHRDYYVPVGNTQVLFDEFTREMDDLTTLERAGQLVLATGESGCGKTALLNRCAWHLADRLGTADVVDLRACLRGRPPLAVEDRLGLVADLLLVKLNSGGALHRGAIDRIERYRGKPDEIYLNLADALLPNKFALVLLPTSDLAAEVVRYGSLACPRVLFMIEYALLDARAEEDIREMERWAPPVSLRVDGLKPGDVHRFAEDRFTRHTEVGTYPRMSRKTLNSAAERLRTVAQLQSTFHGTYDARLRNGIRYDDRSYVTFGEISTYLLNELRDGQGGRS